MTSHLGMTPTLLALLVAASVACRRTEIVQSFPDSFVGVGLELRIEAERPVVVRALPGGPGAVAGVLPGDVITDIDNRSTEGIGLGEVVMRLRGRPNTQVTLSVRRAEQRVLLVLRRQAMTKGGKDYRPTTPN